MGTNNSIKWMMLLLASVAITIQSCGQAFINKPLDTYDRYRTQKIENRDRIFIFYTAKEWSVKNIHPFQDYSRMYKMKNSDIEYFLGGIFYSPDRLKMMVWIGEKTPNVRTSEVYNKKDTNAYVNKMCPTEKDTVFHMSVLVGIRNDTNEFWKLYPFNNIITGCGLTKEAVINATGKYYFEDMKDHEMDLIAQDNPNKGLMIRKAYGYNLQDTNFWDRCWLWEKDTVGAVGLYPFQISSYRYANQPSCNKCGEELITPQINYPEEIWNLYSTSKKTRDSINSPAVQKVIQQEKIKNEKHEVEEWKEQMESIKRK